MVQTGTDRLDTGDDEADVRCRAGPAWSCLHHPEGAPAGTRVNWRALVGTRHLSTKVGRPWAPHPDAQEAGQSPWPGQAHSWCHGVEASGGAAAGCVLAPTAKAGAEPARTLTLLRAKTPRKRHLSQPDLRLVFPDICFSLF